jgi:putative FmdB family regulatory protein
MPTYEFQCTECQNSFPKVLPFGTKETPPCPVCGGVTRKLIKPPMIHFKGSGFYKTDNAGSSEPAAKPKDSKPKTSEKKSAPPAPSPA